MASEKCPHCKRYIKFVMYKDEMEKVNRNTFESVQDGLPPGRGLKSLFWFLAGNKYQPQPKPQRLIVRSEVKTTPHRTLINEYEIPATEDEIRKLAKVYVVQGLSWSRANTVNEARLSQDKHHKIQKAFFALLFLEVKNKTSYDLTAAGLRFLRHFVQ